MDEYKLIPPPQPIPGSEAVDIYDVGLNLCTTGEKMDDTYLKISKGVIKENKLVDSNDWIRGDPSMLITEGIRTNAESPIPSNE